MGPEGRLTKLDNLQIALHFVRLHILSGKPHPDYPGVYERTHKMEEVVSGYKHSLRRKKMQKLEERLAELSEVTNIVDCQPMLDDLHDLVRMAEVTSKLDEEKLGCIMTILASLLLYKSWQRPGGICNATFQEYKGAKLAWRGRREGCQRPNCVQGATASCWTKLTGCASKGTLSMSGP